MCCIVCGIVCCVMCCIMCCIVCGIVCGIACGIVCGIICVVYDHDLFSLYKKLVVACWNIYEMWNTPTQSSALK